MWGKKKLRSDEFKLYLKKNNLPMSISKDPSGTITFYAIQSLGDNLPTIKIGIVFDEDERYLHMFIGDYVKIINSRKESILKLINEINGNNYFVTFFEIDNDVALKYSIDISCAFDSNSIMKQLSTMVDASLKYYADFLKQVWYNEIL